MVEQSNWQSKLENLVLIIGEDKIEMAQRQVLGGLSQKIRDDFYLASLQQWDAFQKDNNHKDIYLFENFFLSSFRPSVHENYAISKKKYLSEVKKTWL